MFAFRYVRRDDYAIRVEALESIAFGKDSEKIQTMWEAVSSEETYEQPADYGCEEYAGLFQEALSFARTLIARLSIRRGIYQAHHG